MLQKISWSDLVEFYTHPVTIHNDIFDHIKLVLCKSPDVQLIHTDSNEIQDN